MITEYKANLMPLVPVYDWNGDHVSNYNTRDAIVNGRVIVDTANGVSDRVL